MKLIIAGGRKFVPTIRAMRLLEKLRAEHDITEVVSGKATGADRMGEVWAKSHGIPVKEFPADWKNLGKRAGYVRNAEMAAYADAVALFPGGKGTHNMRQEAYKANLTVFDY